MVTLISFVRIRTRIGLYILLEKDCNLVSINRAQYNNVEYKIQ